MVYFICIYLLLNLICFILMGLDKRRAKRGEWRIKESTLWTIAILGGAIGGTLGMNIFRHKTKHASFKFGFPTVLLVQLLLIIYLFKTMA